MSKRSAVNVPFGPPLHNKVFGPDNSRKRVNNSYGMGGKGGPQEVN